MKHLNFLTVILAIMLSMIIIPSCGSDSDDWFDPEMPENTDGDNGDDNTQPTVDYSTGDVMFEDGVYENKNGTMRIIVDGYNLTIQTLSNGQVVKESKYTYYIKDGMFYLFYNNKLNAQKSYKEGQGVAVLGDFHKIS